MSLSREEVATLAARGFMEPDWFCKFFFPHWFPEEIPWVHLGLLAILCRTCGFLDSKPLLVQEKILTNFVSHEDPRDEESPLRPIFKVNERGKFEMNLGRYTLVMMPRGSSKTTICNAVSIWNICYQETKLNGYVSETATHAELQLTNVTAELGGNQRLIAVFGTLKPPQRADGLRWSESEGFIQTTTGVTVFARGRGSQIRGYNVWGRRPDRLIFDDLEDKDSVSTDAQREKTRNWFFGDAMPALAEMNPDATAVALGTLLHADALLTLLRHDPEWTTVVFGALDRQGDPIWAAWMDAEKIERRKQSYALKGLLHIFYMEYFNTIRAPEDAPFRPEYIRVETLPLASIPYRALALDPAISKARRAAKSAIVAAGMSVNGVVVMLDEWAKQGAEPREQIEKFFEMRRRWLVPGMVCGVESVAWQRALVHFMQEEMFRRAKTEGPSAYFEIKPITHSHQDGSKDERIEGILQPRYASGYVRHVRHLPQLEMDLLDWPNGTRDTADAAAMAVALLDDFAPVAAGRKLEEDEYPPLEEVLGGDWRVA